MQVLINKLSYKYPNSSISLFENVSITFSEEWSCIIGSNGAGKTTLLKLIAKKLIAQSGSIKGNKIVYYCEQKLDALPEGYEEFIYTFNTKTFKLKELLGIEDEWLYRWESLSFGERKRVQIAIALYNEPDILLLDEPTNHLDYSTKKIVINALMSFTKIGIVVSHDRELLNTLCTTTIILKNSKIFKYKTEYKNALNEYLKEMNSLNKKYEIQNQKIKTLQKNIYLQKEKVLKNRSKLSKKDIDKKDRSAKEKINLAKLTGKDKNDSKKVASLNTKYEHLNSQKISLAKEYKKGLTIKKNERETKLFPIILKGGELKLGENKSLSYPDISIEKDDKIALIGDNGTGKSSFIKHLLQSIEVDELLYLPQEIDAKMSQKLFQTIDELSNRKKGELYTLVTRLSSNPKRVLENRYPSPGELRKLLIAKALLDGVSLIILDEPTNHMDLASTISIEEALGEYEGALLTISHDRKFIENIAKVIWEISKESSNHYLMKIV